MNYKNTPEGKIVRQKYGKNAVLKGTSYMECATMRERNEQIGGHKAK